MKRFGVRGGWLSASPLWTLARRASMKRANIHILQNMNGIMVSRRWTEWRRSVVPGRICSCDLQEFSIPPPHAVELGRLERVAAHP